MCLQLSWCAGIIPKLSSSLQKSLALALASLSSATMPACCASRTKLLYDSPNTRASHTCDYALGGVCVCVCTRDIAQTHTQAHERVQSWIHPHMSSPTKQTNTHPRLIPWRAFWSDTLYCLRCSVCVCACVCIWLMAERHQRRRRWL